MKSKKTKGHKNFKPGFAQSATLPAGNLGKPKMPIVWRYQPPNYAAWSSNPRPQWPITYYPIEPVQPKTPSRQVARAERRASVKNTLSRARFVARVEAFKKSLPEPAVTAVEDITDDSPIDTIVSE